MYSALVFVFFFASPAFSLVLYYHGKAEQQAKLLRELQAASPINVTLWKWREIEEFMCMVLVSILMSTWTLKGSFLWLALCRRPLL